MKQNRLTISLLLVLILLVIVQIGITLRQSSFMHRESEDRSQVAGESPTIPTGKTPSVPVESDEGKYPSFIDTLIASGADQVYRITRDGKTYYRVIDVQQIAFDGPYYIYSPIGAQVAGCSPMMPNEDKPVLCQDVEGDITVYSRE